MVKMEIACKKSDLITLAPIDKRIFWEDKAERLKLERVDKSCHDCAITTGFYTPLADELLEFENEMQDKVLNGWICHNDCSKSCRGAYNYIQMKRKKEAKYGE